MSYLASRVVYITRKINEAQEKINYYLQKRDEIVAMGLDQIESVNSLIATKHAKAFEKYGQFTRSADAIRRYALEGERIDLLAHELLSELDEEMETYINDAMQTLLLSAQKEVGDIDGVPITISLSGTGRGSTLSFDLDIASILVDPADTVIQMTQAQQSAFALAVAPAPAPMAGSVVSAAVEGSLST